MQRIQAHSQRTGCGQPHARVVRQIDQMPVQTIVPVFDQERGNPHAHGRGRIENDGDGRRRPTCGPLRTSKATTNIKSSMPRPWSESARCWHGDACDSGGDHQQRQRARGPGGLARKSQPGRGRRQTGDEQTHAHDPGRLIDAKTNRGGEDRHGLPPDTIWVTGVSPRTSRPVNSANAAATTITRLGRRIRARSLAPTASAPRISRTRGIIGGSVIRLEDSVRLESGGIVTRQYNSCKNRVKLGSILPDCTFQRA